MEWWGFFFFLLSLPSQFLWHARRRTAVQDACEGTRLDTLRSPVLSLAPHFKPHCHACRPGCGLCTEGADVLLMPRTGRRAGGRTDGRTEGHVFGSGLQAGHFCIPCIVNKPPPQPARNIDGMRPE